jgi:hypothetical protein
MPRTKKTADATAPAAKGKSRRRAGKPAAHQPVPDPVAAVDLPRERPAGEPAREKATNVCLCGCGATTGGGRFLPGHDARLKSELLGTFRGEGLSAEQQALVASLRWERFMTAAPVKAKRPLRDPAEMADLRAQLGRAIDCARDCTRDRAERLEAVHWLDKLFRGPLTDATDLDAVVAQLDAEAESPPEQRGGAGL